MTIIELDIAQTTGVAAVLLVVGEFIKNRVGVLSRYFIPAPIIGGLVFSLVALAGHQTGLFTFQFYDNMRAFLLMVFFTTIGFSASFELLKKGGVGVALFLAAAVGLVVLQNLLANALQERQASGDVSLDRRRIVVLLAGGILVSLWKTRRVGDTSSPAR